MDQRQSPIPMLRSGAVFAVAIALTAPMQAAFGHAGLVSSDPGRRAALTSAPSRIRLCFNESIEIKFSKLSLEDAQGAAVPLGELRADPKKPACVFAPLAALADGSYTVRFRVLSVDGHVVDKSYGFSLKSP